MLRHQDAEYAARAQRAHGQRTAHGTVDAAGQAQHHATAVQRVRKRVAHPAGDAIDLHSDVEIEHTGTQCIGSHGVPSTSALAADIRLDVVEAVQVLGRHLLVGDGNAVNFMDGANGLAMGMALIAALGLSLCAAFTGAWTLALLSMAVAGGLAGFLVWNIPGKLFVGDAGAYFAGAILGGLGLEFVRLRPDLLFVPPMLLLPFLSDVLMTLAWRSMHGKKLFAAHRDHTYQIAMKAGLHHWQVSLVHAFWALNAAVVAVASTILGGQMPAIAGLSRTSPMLGL